MIQILRDARGQLHKCIIRYQLIELYVIYSAHYKMFQMFYCSHYFTVWSAQKLDLVNTINLNLVHT